MSTDSISDTAAAWEATGLTLEERWEFHRNKIGPQTYNTYVPIVERGLVDTFGLVQIIAVGISPESYLSYLDLGFTHDDILKLKNCGMVPEAIEEIWELMGSRVDDVEALVRLRRSGFSKSFLKQMKRLGVRNFLLMEKLSKIPASTLADLIKAGATVDDLFDEDGDPVTSVDALKLRLSKAGLGHLRRFFGYDARPTDSEIEEARMIYDAGLTESHYLVAAGNLYAHRVSKVAIGSANVIEISRLGWDIEMIKNLYEVVFSNGVCIADRKVLLGDDLAEGFVRLAKSIPVTSGLTTSLDRISDMMQGSGWGASTVVKAMQEDFSRLIDVFKVVPTIRHSGAEYAWMAYSYAYESSKDPFILLEAMKAHVEKVGSGSVWLSWVSGNYYKNLDRPKTLQRIKARVAKAAAVKVDILRYNDLRSIGAPEEQMAEFLGRMEKKVKVDDGDD